MKGLGRPARLLGAVALLAAVAWVVGPQRLRDSLVGTDPLWFLCALALGIVANIVSALRWAFIARALKLHAPNTALLAMYARGVTSNTLLPGATLSGDALRAFELSRLGNPKIESAVSVAFDRFSGLWVLCVMSCAAAALAWMGASDASMASDRLAPGNQNVLLAYGLMLVGIVVAPFMPWPVRWIRRLPGSLGPRLADLWQRLRDPASGLKRQLARSLIGSLVVQLLSALALAACARALNVQVPLVWLLAASAPIFVMAAVPIGVAGFGTRELAAVGVLGLLGVAADRAAATGLLVGLCGVLMGLMAAPLLVLRGRQP
jgi:uncharacterized membrane protein YbhN (UPF0104 family)